jgi:teichoic acid transport system permease protein
VIGPPDMIRLGETPKLRQYLRAIWERRQFAVSIAAGEVRAQNMDTVLGNLWQVLNPLMLAGVYYLVFGLVLRIDRGVDNYIAFLVIGVFVFHFTQRSVMSGAKAIVSNEGLIRSIRFPRAILPIASVVGQAIMFLPALAIMLAIALATDETPHPMWLLLLPLFILQGVGNLGAALFVARMTDRIRDVQYVLPYLFRLLFYVSGILYSVERFVPEQYMPLFELNPVFCFATAARGLILDHELLLQPWGVGAAWAVALMVLGLRYFRRAEHEYGRG